MKPGANNASEVPFRSGFVAICGRPNVGKSTLLNALIGQSLAVVSPRPQTTRERMLGIWTTPEFQAVLVDTPGMHRARSALNRHMIEEAKRAASDVDALLLLAEAPQLRNQESCEKWQPGPGACAALELLQSVETLEGKIILVITKCDQLVDKDHILPVIERWQALHRFAAILPVSATENIGLQQLREEITSYLPIGPRYYDNEQLSDRSMRWHAAELIRGEIFRIMGQELPYSCAVTIDRFHEGLRSDRIEALLHVERPSQKAIAIGHKGRTIRELSASARKKIAEISGRPCDLRLQVRVEKNWTTSPLKMARLGYTGDSKTVLKSQVKSRVKPQIKSRPA